MNTYFETAVTMPDEKAIEMERKAMLEEIDRLNGELSHMKSDNEMLKNTIVHMSMKLVGVVN